jgi:hypothetical protein
MPHPHEPDASSRPPHKPLCPACGKPMRLVHTTPLKRYSNLDDCLFECVCGERANYVMMARQD